MTVKSLDTLIQELKTFLRAYSRRLDTGDNSIAKELLITPFAVGGKIIMDQVSNAEDLHIVSRMSGTDLDNEATNYKLERLPGTYSTCILYFYANTAPTSSITIPAGTKVQTTGTAFSSPILFETISDTSFDIADISAYYSYDRTRYEFPVDAICLSIGSAGNVASNTLSTIVSSAPSGISGCTNLVAASGGTDEESDDDLRTRIKLTATGRDLNVPNGIRSELRTLGFQDAYMVRIEDADAERTNGVDVFVIDQAPSTYSETFTYDAAQTAYVFSKRPVITVTAIVDGLGNTISSSDYDVHIDSTSSLRRSVYGQDYLTVFPSSGLTTGDVFVVTYTYSEKIVQAQQYFNNIANRVLTSNIYIKRSFPLYLYVTAALTMKASADGPTTRNQIRSALAQWVTEFNLDDNLQKSDLTVVLQTGYGDYPVDSVDAVVISSYYLQDEFGNVYLPVGESITVSSKQYVVYGNAILS